MSFDLNRVMTLNRLGVILLCLAGVLVYGSKGIAKGILGFPEDKSLTPILILKGLGLLSGIFGVLKIMGIL